jgi:hypothetical protein
VISRRRAVLRGELWASPSMIVLLGGFFTAIGGRLQPYGRQRLGDHRSSLARAGLPGFKAGASGGSGVSDGAFDLR